ncbi:MAG: 5'-3' exonuclease [Propionicimonas sp.]|uniref:5'-3' exonuclease n=1 Tax=Propionicimonas sp. TaxID=1955623 RepID=UPI002B1F44FF|nr:5'-3' exonuclease [Propionicimonas sp.]MEA4945742.1 5'-3' exonuclease [Propionicimonas sp.]MEA5052150.1 5'-3' exonuclease [Propionicimonas sp.]MEA5117297.1 5'-3' exonuclease [Propionicimonas sp.]
MDAPRLMLLDTASLYFRAFYGLPDTLRSPDGTPVNAVRGLLDFIARFVAEYSPTHLACCWDNSWRPAWRVELLPSYKAHRVAAVATDSADGFAEQVPDGLEMQVPLIRQVLAAAGLPVVGVDGYEADDVIGTLATSWDGPVEVVTGDRDLFQLVDDGRAHRVLYCARGVSRHDRVDDAWLTARYGITGAGYVDFAVLRGDPSDGLPGVAGIGEKTAAALIGDHHDLAGIVAAADRGDLAAAVTRRLQDAADYLGPARTVVAVATDVPLPALDLTLPAAPPDPAAFTVLAGTLGLGGSADRLLQALAGRST